jgi:hypothetical protein
MHTTCSDYLFLLGLVDLMIFDALYTFVRYLLCKFLRFVLLCFSCLSQHCFQLVEAVESAPVSDNPELEMRQTNVFISLFTRHNLNVL